MVDPTPPDDFVADQAGLSEHPKMAADGGPGYGEKRGNLAGAEIAARQGRYDVPACRISDRRERIHGRKRNSSVTFLRAVPEAGAG